MEKNSFQIKPIGASELSTLLEVYRQCEDFLALGPVPIASMEMVLADLQLAKDSGGIFCGIYLPQVGMAGVLDYVPQHYLGNPAWAYIEHLMIVRSCRRMGLGAAVVEWLEGEIRKNPEVTVIKAGVQVNNLPAVAFWQQQGYRIIGGPEMLPDHTICYALEKLLEL